MIAALVDVKEKGSLLVAVGDEKEEGREARTNVLSSQLLV